MVFDWGYNILVTDYRTFGKSGGELNGQDQLYADAEKVYEYAIGLGYHTEQIILYGYSMGAAMVSHLAACKTAKAVILESGYSSVNEMEFSAGRCAAYEFNNAQKAMEISMPTLIIHGELDAIITADHAERIWGNLGSAVKQKFILEGGGHGDLRSRPEYQGLINGFIDQIKCTVSSKVKDRSEDPCFERKADKAVEILRKYGFPTELLRLQAEKIKK